jgi:hypothetical protein
MKGNSATAAVKIVVIISGFHGSVIVAGDFVLLRCVVVWLCAAASRAEALEVNITIQPQYHIATTVSVVKNCHNLRVYQTFVVKGLFQITF